MMACVAYKVSDMVNPSFRVDDGKGFNFLGFFDDDFHFLTPCVFSAKIISCFMSVCLLDDLIIAMTIMHVNTFLKIFSIYFSVLFLRLFIHKLLI